MSSESEHSTRSSISAASSGRLCDNCKYVQRIGQQIPPEGETWEDEKDVFWGKFEQDCPLCQQIKDMAPVDRVIDSIKLDFKRLGETAATKHYGSSLDQRPYDVLSIHLALEPKEGFPPSQYLNFGLIGLPLEHDIRTLHRDPQTIDHKRVRQWLDHCQSNHLQSCHNPARFDIHEFKVINCVTGAIVPLPSMSEEYAALSYVWGRPRTDDNAYPQTVRDSMVVTLSLGIRYLWVDRYCIDQNNEAIKLEQIGKMDRIYAQAYLTIFATTGDAYHGIPGVNGLIREPRRKIRLGEQEMEELQHPEQLVAKSIWASRAWTYQEGCLSRRKLFFTEQGVVFWCGKMYCDENISRSLSRDRTTNDAIPYELEWSVPSIWPGPDQTSSSSVVEQYSGRDMSFDSDALNACLGIFNALEITHYWGVPIGVRDWGDLHLMVLCWYNLDLPPKERSDFPTWSWTRWAGRKAFAMMHRPSSIQSIEIQLMKLKWVDVLRNVTYCGNLAYISPGRTLRITGNTLQPRFVFEDHQLFTIVQSVQGKDFHLRTVLDITGHQGEKDPCILETLHDVTLLEFESLYKNLNGSADIYDGYYILLKEEKERYRRIGLTVGARWDRGAWDLQLGPIPLKGITARTIYLE